MPSSGIFQSKIITDQGRTRVFRNREYILSKSAAERLNTYKNFGIFPMYNRDIKPDTWDPADKEYKDAYIKGSKANQNVLGVRSMFNRYAAVPTGKIRYDVKKGAGSDEQQKAVEDAINKSSALRIGHNMPLMDNPSVRQKIRENTGCSVKEIVQASRNGFLGRATYDYSDFMYCKYLGKVPNNYLITLRRFPVPVHDSIRPIAGTMVSKTLDGSPQSDIATPIGTMVTWMGVSGNDMKSILTYDYSMPYEEKTADWQEIENDGGGQSGILNTMEAALNPATRKAYEQGYSVPAMGAFTSFFGMGGNESPYGETDIIAQRDKNKLYGPIDRVKKLYRRSDQGGLEWNQKFTVTFEYELRAYNGINPRQAMLDLIANILAVTYTPGSFWGGGYKGSVRGQSNYFRNMSIFKASGGFTNFMDAIVNDISSGVSAVKSTVDQNGGDYLQTIKNLANNFMGILMGGLINKLGRPAKYFYPSLLMDVPAGLWHITIGNPMRPIMSMGNMVLKSCKIEHSGPLGLDDFPSNLKVTCEFDRGRVRDSYGTQALYTSGQENITHTMSRHVRDMYDAAERFKSGSAAGTPTAYNEDSNTPASSEEPYRIVSIKAQVPGALKPSKRSQDMINDHFGDFDQDSVVYSAGEMGHGEFPINKKQEDAK